LRRIKLTRKFSCALIFIFVFCSVSFASYGQIYREYSYTKRWGESDPCATHPWAQRYRKRAEKVLEGIDLKKAVKAELRVEYWGGHIGTGEQKFRVNNNDWIYIPQPENTPTDPACYYRTVLGNPPVEIPLEHLKSGSNVFQFTAGSQIKYNFGWGWYHIYCFTLRVYYDRSKPHPTGRIIFPYAGAAIGDKAVTAASAQSSNSKIKQVDFVGYYEDFDWAGNGQFRQWHYQYQYGKIRHHLGTATEQPYAVVWDSVWVPDQDEPMKLRAAITDEDGVTYLTPAVEDVHLVRQGRTVKMYTSCDVPEVFGAYRAQKNYCTIEIVDKLKKAGAAKLVISTWSGEELSEIGINDKPLANELGKIIDYSYYMIDVPVKILKRGTNRFYAFSTSDYHKAEINWPGPVLLVEFRSPEDLGKGRLTTTMLRALQSENRRVREYAAQSLGQLKCTSAADVLIKCLKDNNWNVRAAAAKALGQIGDDAAVRPLLEVLRTEEKYTRDIWRVRKNAVTALSQINGRKAVEYLIAALQDQDPFIRAYAAYALGHTKSKKAVKALKVLLEDKNANVRKCASDALYKLTGKKQ